MLVLYAALTPYIAKAEQADIAWVARGEFCEPETVLPLPDRTLLVSNVCGFGEAGTGFLSLLAIDGTVLEWRIVDELDAPLGMATAGDRLYVVDSNRIRVLRNSDFSQQSMFALDTAVANDIAVAEDGTVYVTDTARGNVVIVDSEGKHSILGKAGQFPGANGIHIDDDDLYVGGERLWHVDLRDSTQTTLGPTWVRDIDGIEIEADGTLQLTPVGGPLIRLGTPIQVLDGEGISSANHGYAADMGLAFIPTGFENTVIAIRVPSRPEP
ncbi:MAG: hypothetical protein AAGA95_13920 [Pseudomonadota bacterium]